MNQIKVALIQLEKSCELFLQQDYVCSLTLAGAAEGILDDMAQDLSSRQLGRQKGDTNTHTAFNIEAGLMESMFDIPYREYKRSRNYLRNRLKHSEKGYQLDLSEIHIDCKNLINHAITNYKLITGKLPDSQYIKKFCEEIGVS